MYSREKCVLLSQSPVSVDFLIAGEDDDWDAETTRLRGDEYQLRNVGEGNIVFAKKGKTLDWDRYGYACLLAYQAELTQLDPKEKTDYKKYSREGMRKRVLDERRDKAEKAEYRIEWASNIYGDHLLANEAGVKYKVFLRDFEHETGYSDSADAAYNKLGTTKHIMYAFKRLKEDKKLYNKLDKTFPFIEVYCDPLNDYRISWFYPDEPPPDEKALLAKYFKKAAFIADDRVRFFLGFIEEAAGYGTIRIRPEVREKVERYYDDLMLADLREKSPPDYSCIKTGLFPYQKEGVNFVLYRRAAIIADEMGLGKTIQAIAAAVFKKQIFGFQKTLIVCPATLKAQWKKEIEKFSGEAALILSGFPEQRERLYKDEGYFFFIVNYETVLRDSRAINSADFDFLILDEAQKIKNYETKTASAVKRLRAKHKLVITGTPIENRLIDIYSIINTLDPFYLGPLWEFSWQHCLFDPVKLNKINGYYDLQRLNARLSGILIRREKSQVLSQLPTVQQREVPVVLSPLQKEIHAGFMTGIARIIRKKFLTPYDVQRLNLLLNSARMVCDSTFLIDDKTNESPKLAELQDILFEKLDVQNSARKIIIFSEWIKMHKLIGDLLRKHGVGFTELNGTVPVKARGALIKNFEDDPQCKVFLSTEAGGAGLNLQVADILINFELPWNPAKKNQRIGRIDRLGQKSSKLTIYNLVSRDSIEQQIAAGLLVKQSLFEGVLSDGSTLNYVDFSTKGRSQFIQQLEALINQPAESDAGQAAAPASGPGETAAVTAVSSTPAAGEVIGPASAERQARDLEQVLNSGMDFLAGLFRMSTGTELDLKDQKIEVDRQTGEVTMRFKLGAPAGGGRK
ncbi:MAG: DEAD/DEAH box helicase [Spirochaetaceae bacterium]|nr:DEAD/DEAH box helicase [Spirochaetaceae bacterium]